VCDVASTKCVAATGVYCQACTPPQSDADPPPCGDASIQCIGLEDANQDPLGSYCMPPCSTDAANPCPSGWKCDDSGSQGKLCIRQCNEAVPGCAI
jgi:hypothetical protein